MSKQNLIDTFALQTGTSKAEAERAVNAVLQALQSELQTGNKVAIVGFGSFQVKHQPARDARNPSNGEIIVVPAKNVVKFKAGTKLLEAVN